MLIKATDILAKARTIYCVGARATFPVAFLFDYAQRYFSDKICLLEGAGGSGIDLMHRVTNKDALLTVSLSPYANSTYRATELAHRAGAKIVAITDSELSPIARLAQVTILVSAQSPSFFDTISPALAAAEVLVALLASRAGPDVPKKIRQHEKHLRDAGVFWTPNKRNQRPESKDLVILNQREDCHVRTSLRRQSPQRRACVDVPFSDLRGFFQDRRRYRISRNSL